MRAIFFNTVDYIAYKSQVRYFQAMNWLNTYKLWIVFSIALVGIVLAAGETFGWEKLSE